MSPQMNRYLKSFLSAVVALSFSAQANAAIDIKARQYLLMDFQTGTVLEAKNADVKMPPSSMAKLMTAYLVFEALKSGKLSLEDQLPVSRYAWQQGGAASGGSTMFLDPNSKAKVEDLIRGMIIQSGNDACIVLAEGLGGSESAFVDMMNETAKKIGLTGSHFSNVTGLPDAQHYMTARDLITLSKRLLDDFPEYHHYDWEKEFTYNGIKQGNRNPLLYKDLGADGMKTGHTDEAGYGLTASVVRGDRHILMVLSGMKTMKVRAQESERLIEWAFREFNSYKLVKAGETLDEATVWLGTEPKVPVTTKADAVVTLARKSRKDMKVTAVYDGQIKAPVAKGATVGKLVVTAPDMKPVEFPLVAAQSVDRLGVVGRVATAAGYLVWGKRN